MKKILVSGLGNIGEKYQETRHNIGFKICDYLVREKQTYFQKENLGNVARFNYKGKTFIILKPNTYMNLSGKVVSYWVHREKIELENLLVVTDDINIDFGAIRIKSKGSAGGHNGLRDIEEKLQTRNYPRFRFGVGSLFSKGLQVDYVLGDWSVDQISILDKRIPICVNAILSFGTEGITSTMNKFNGSYKGDFEY